MNNILIPSESLNTSEIIRPLSKRLGLRTPVLCKILNQEELYGIVTSRALRTSPFPVAILEVTAESFDADYFSCGSSRFVSERLRDVMGLDPSEVQYFDIDDRRSAPATRAKKFKIMEPVAVEDVSDRSKTNYDMRRLLPEDPEYPCVISGVVIREDAQPKHPLFFDAFFDELFCTEAFALRILSAGCTGLNFRCSGYRLWPRLYRTLRGIEEYVDWDPVNGVEITKLVKAIR